MVLSSMPNSRRHRRYKATLTLKGYTYSSFARRFGFRYATVKAAIRGDRGGPKCLEVIETLKKADHVS